MKSKPDSAASVSKNLIITEFLYLQFFICYNMIWFNLKYIKDKFEKGMENSNELWKRWRP